MSVKSYSKVSKISKAKSGLANVKSGKAPKKLKGVAIYK